MDEAPKSAAWGGQVGMEENPQRLRIGMAGSRTRREVCGVHRDLPCLKTSKASVGDHSHNVMDEVDVNADDRLVSLTGVNPCLIREGNSTNTVS